jgi:hypothetical protein
MSAGLVLSRLPVDEKTDLGIIPACSSNCQRSVTIYVMHHCNIPLLIFIGILDEAEGVDPQVSVSQASGDLNRILKGPR